LAWEWFRGGHCKDVDKALNTERVVYVFDSH